MFFGYGLDEVSEEVGEEAGAGLGEFWRVDFGDGGDGAEVFIEDDVFDEVVCIVCVGVGGDGFAAGGGAGFSAVAAGGGFSAVAAGGGARIAREVAAGDEQSE